MKTLQECSWKEFAISDVFDVSGTITTHPSKLVAKGNTPRVTCAATNNGLDDFYTNEPTEKGGVITIDSATIGFVGYHPYDFIATDHVEKLTLKDGQKLPYLAGLFVKKAIENAVGTKYSYGYKFAQQRIKRQTILLPTTPDGTPDWQFMEDYMREVEKKLLSQALPILQERISKSKNISGGVKINKQSWKEFAITDIFIIKATQSGIDRNKLIAGDGDTPYITRSDANNGWDSFICDQPKYLRDQGNVLSVGLDTQTAFYQPCPFYTGQNIQVFSSPQLNRYVAAFIIPLLKIQLQKFNWGGNGATLGRLKKSKILLPTTPACTPDYDLMETYMREVENRQLEEYISIAGRKGIV